jgi:methionyl-tRNA formyltransferase
MDLPRIVFMGTAELSCTVIQALIESRTCKLLAVVTQPDRPRGRDLRTQASAVKELALTAQLQVLQPERARDPAFLNDMKGLSPDLVVVAAYGQILPKTILEVPKHGCLNVHTSLLPKYRGAAPIQWAILKGESETGVTIMKMDAGMDTGDILTQERTAVTSEDNSETLYARLARMGAQMLVRTIPDYLAGKIEPRPQPAEGVSYAPKIKKEDGRIDWKQSATVVGNQVRGLTPWPGTFAFLTGSLPPQLIKIWKAEGISDSGPPGEVLRADKSGIVVGCSSGALRILSLQREGGRRLTPQEFLAGHQLRPGQTFN